MDYRSKDEAVLARILTKDRPALESALGGLKPDKPIKTRDLYKKIKTAERKSRRFLREKKRVFDKILSENPHYQVNLGRFKQIFDVQWAQKKQIFDKQKKIAQNKVIEKLKSGHKPT